MFDRCVRIPHLAAVGLLGLGLSTSPISAEEVVDLARFGKAGDLRPTVGESLIGDDFYTQDMTLAAASREYYTAVWSVPSTVESRTSSEKSADGDITVKSESSALGRAQLGLVLSNPLAAGPEAELVDITVSLRHSSGVRNYLVRLESGEQRGLTFPSGHPELGRLETIVMLAFGPFAADVALDSSRGRQIADALDVMAPVSDSGAEIPNQGEKAVNYCKEIDSWIRVIDAAGVYVVAKDKRVYQNTTPWGWDVYYHDIEYPAGTLFHRGNGASRTGSHPACKAYRHGTIRTDYSKTHDWFGMDDLVMLCQGPATAVCTSVCDATFTVTLTGSSLGRCF